MKQARSFYAACLLSFVLSGICSDQRIQTFQHPTLNFQVQAFSDWITIPHPENEMIFEIKDPESVCCIRMWYTTAPGSVTENLKNFALQKNFVFNDEPIKGNIKGKDAWILDATCCMNKTPVRVVLIAIPDQNQTGSFYAAQVGCPEDKLKEKEPLIESIIYSFAVTE